MMRHIRYLYVLELRTRHVPDPCGTCPRAWPKLDHLVVQRYLFELENPELCRLILPPARFAEKSGTCDNTNVQCKWGPPAVPPPATPKEDWWIRANWRTSGAEVDNIPPSECSSSREA